jgi:transposase
MDLRTRVLRDADAGMSSQEVAAKYAVSRSWVDRIKQRRRETGVVTPRKQTTFRRRTLSDEQEQRLVFLVTARPDATLAELRERLPTQAALSTLWRTLARFGLTVKKNRIRRGTTPP